jgi:ATP-dependent RNA circularization protein (DNA/RNA ligase family)
MDRKFMKETKPLGYKSYGSIPHLIGSRLGEGDHHAEKGQCRIATEKKRDKHDFVIVQEKLDGGNVGIAKLNGKILPITRAGYLAQSSPYKTHHAFAEYVRRNEKRFYELLNDNERICGEWLLTAVGTLYDLPHEPFVPFDLFHQKERYNRDEFNARLAYSYLPKIRTLSIGEPLSIDSALEMIKTSGHGAVEPVEGAIWRVERNQKVDFLVKFVHQDKVDGKYLKEDVINTMPKEFDYLKDFFLIHG